MSIPADERPARQQLLEAIKPLCPRGWVWLTDERQPVDDGKVHVHLLQRTIEPSGYGSTAAHAIGFTVTVTVPQPDLERAEDQLDDDILSFLYALTAAHIKWTTATKATYDGRLGYQLGLTIGSSRKG